MADYRAIVRHVRYWRGTVHRWSTSYEMTGSLTAPLDPTACQTLLEADSKMLYGGTLSSGNGYNCEIYNASGGTPLATYTAFDWTTPGSWTQIPAAGTAWTATSQPQETAAEVALLVEWPAGLSRTGKPVKFRKWYHQVPVGAGSGGDVSSANRTALAAQANAVSVCLYAGYGLALGKAGRSPGTPVVNAFYGNHQMPRGRRRKVIAAKQASADYSQILQILESEAYKNANP